MPVVLETCNVFLLSAGLHTRQERSHYVSVASKTIMADIPEWDKVLLCLFSILYKAPVSLKHKHTFPP